MKISVLALGLSLFCGCASNPSVHDYLLQSPNPTPFKAPGHPVPASEAAKIYDEYRGYVNDQGVQIGHRHFNVERLPDYFRDSQFDLLGQRADRAYWNELAEKTESNYDGLFKGGFGAGGGQSLEAYLAVMAAFIVLATVTSVEASIEVPKKRRKAMGSTETIKQVMGSYNHILAHALGISFSAGALSIDKEFPRALPTAVQTGDNSSKEDWLEDFNLRQQGSAWWLGYQPFDPELFPEKLYPQLRSSPFKIHKNKFTWIGWGLDCAAAYALIIGAEGAGKPKFYGDGNDWAGNAFLGCGAAFGTLGLVCHWKAWSQKRGVLEGFNKTMKARLFPAGGPQ